MKSMICGINPVREALKAAGENRAEIDCICVSFRRKDSLISGIVGEARRMGIAVRECAPEELYSITGGAPHQGVIAYLRGGYRYIDLDDLLGVWKGSGERAFFLLLDSIQDPQNMGSLLRAAHTAGTHGVVVPKDRSCPVTAAVIKASAGAAMHTPVAMVTNLRDAIKRLKDEGVWVVGVEAGSEKSIYRADLEGDIAIVVGSEGKGLRRLVKEECDFCVHIPMRGVVNSLSSAQAGVVALFEARRQRDRAGK
ncbi:MAG: 23S rRNA (guanosine(2251)-2'-O)-methyltransferase RlmB [Deltaproteobacteria bacterium]|nr:23S rRNA (guanosine(2251)-2'-O)-methyltransferase RlmB [Deltaproteobacteria bacterium]